MLFLKHYCSNKLLSVVISNVDLNETLVQVFIRHIVFELTTIYIMTFLVPLLCANTVFITFKHSMNLHSIAIDWKDTIRYELELLVEPPNLASVCDLFLAIKLHLKK